MIQFYHSILEVKLMQVIEYDQVEDKIIEIRYQKVIIDSDVAELYGVETKRINEPVKNNPKKFPDGYLIKLNSKEKNEVVENFDQFDKLKHSHATVKAFTEKGLYMLATVLKSAKAVDTSLAIVEAFTKLRELNRAIQLTQKAPENSPNQKTLIEHAGELMADLFIPDHALEIKGTETIYEINLALFKIKRTIKKGE